MILAGLQKISLIDFPDKISCVVFVTGCKFACPFCHNPELARGRYPQRLTTDQIIEFLQLRGRLLDGVVVSGGEPTLAPGLADLCSAIRALGLAVKLDTNGSRPEVLAHLIDTHLIDFVAMDIKTDVARYGPPLVAAGESTRIGSNIHQSIRQSIRLIMASDLAYEFRTTCVRPFVDEGIIVEIARAIEGARRYVLQTFRPISLLDPAFFDGLNPGFTPDGMQRLKAEAAPWVGECSIRP
ncbi:MAG: anaerobic ribonucleoside-triphosphate reductase activating protein [Desulfatitalea sp.]